MNQKNSRTRNILEAPHNGFDRTSDGRMKSISEHRSLLADRTTVIVECGRDDDSITRSSIDRKVAKMNIPVMLCRTTLTMENRRSKARVEDNAKSSCH
jgi:hypothetical protein